MSWLSRKRPPAPPPEPSHVKLEPLMAALHQDEVAGHPISHAQQYLRDNAPVAQLDKWGEPMPLNAIDQARLDRLVAVLASPEHRGRALLHSGLILAEEVQAIATAYPEVYDVLSREALRDMLEDAPPYYPWAESALDTLFGKPPQAVISSGAAPSASDMAKPTGKAKGLPGDQTAAGVATPTDRRELGVREAQR